MHFRRFIPALVVLLAVAVAACSGTGRARYDSPEQAYERGYALYQEGRYAAAVRYFQGVFDYGRTTDSAADAQLYLARSYYANGEYILAANEYTRFVSTYRNDPRTEEAEFERALSYYEMSPQYELDQSSTRQALTYLQLFLDRYPASESQARAEELIDNLRSKLAHKEFAAGEMYERRGYWEAAAIQYERVFDEYPDTQYADDALLGAMRSYIEFANRSIEARQAERLQKAVNNYDRLVQLFRDSPLIREAESLFQDASGQLENLISGT